MTAIIDYGVGNIQSIINALNDFNAEYVVTNKISEIDKCSKIILPGVGEAYYAMQKLKEYNLIDYIKKTEKPLLGICLGMQLLTDKSEERDTKCLGIIPAQTKLFNKSEMIVPHMGWNNIKLSEKELLFSEIPNGTSYYFANSYYVENNKYSIAECEYNIKFCVSVKKENFYGIQFHPEKSGNYGIKLLENFIKLC
ncbi:MAG: imidazole glycerol phosphate synthase subunit HisH [bacterium]